LSETLVIRGTSSKYCITVIADRCKGCGICVLVCPTKVLVDGGEYNKYGYQYPLPENAEKCIGCRLCEYSCPDFAIFVEVVED